ncbi:SET domain-containing protein SmydA-8-like [Tigriopus californicus]|uniref:SET domain-containing protein SmydA-8-like n=1 Tax=Tigriopus californicus TaxID=6832 RepID=UPI0027DA32F7|nr:SET domain-containing protein SmydA-8-like [Tigriopus californicus]
MAREASSLQGATQTKWFAATLRCSACYTVHYCQQEHQKSDWKKHKSQCSKPYEVLEDKVVGRYMIAARDLKAGDVILREKPCIVGPNLESSDFICVVCHRVLKTKHFLTCKLCKVPVCSTPCSESDLHRNGECSVLKQKPFGFYSSFNAQSQQVIHRPSASVEHANFQLIIPIRAILLKMKDVKQYKRFMALESHVESREGTDAEVKADERVFRLLEQFRLHEAGNRQLVQKICGIFDTNSFDLAIQDGAKGITGVYLNAAMMMHSCVKNTRIVFSQEHIMTIYARETIHKGDPIYHSYTPILAPTTLRRTLLFVGKNFSCECRRCTDPTEMGSLASAWLCQNPKCQGGVVLPESPIDLTSPWLCSTCREKSFADGEIVMAERKLRLELDALKPQSSMSVLEDFLARYQNVLHPRNALLIEAKRLLSIGYGRFPGYLYPQLSSEQLDRKVAFCREVLAMARILESGIATLIGMAAHELALALAKLVQRNPKKFSPSEMSVEIVNLLRESVYIFSFEPPDSRYGILGQTARTELGNWERESTPHKII